MNVAVIFAFQIKEPATCIQKQEIRPAQGQKLGSKSQAGVLGVLLVAAYQCLECPSAAP